VYFDLSAQGVGVFDVDAEKFLVLINLWSQNTQTNRLGRTDDARYNL
jgi:hypothetical protein